MTLPGSITDCFILASSLSDRDGRLLDELVPERRQYPKNSLVFRQGGASDQLLVVEKGLSFTYRHLEDGSRQIIDIHFPGEIIGLDELSQPRHRSGLMTMTDAAFLDYDKVEVVRLFSRSPTLSRLLLDMVSRGQALLTERMVGLARHSALQRVAHFLLEVQYRVTRAKAPGIVARAPKATEPSGKEYNGSEHNGQLKPQNMLRIPQTVIADALGLSIVHVNRVLRQLRERGLIGSCGHGITLVDIEGLRDVAGWKPGDLWLEPSSVPA